MPMWDERYGASAYVYGKDANAFLVEQAERIAPGARVLSIGEGEGRNAVHLASRGLSDVAVDGSRVGLEKAHALARERGVEVETICGDLANVVFPSALGAVVNIFCHLPSSLRRTVHRRALASLAEGGLVLVELDRPEQIARATGGPKDVDMLATLADLREDFAGCDELVGRAIERDVVEGALHTGRAAGVQLVARKR